MSHWSVLFVAKQAEFGVFNLVVSPITGGDWIATFCRNCSEQ